VNLLNGFNDFSVAANKKREPFSNGSLAEKKTRYCLNQTAENLKAATTLSPALKEGNRSRQMPITKTLHAMYP
jgi:hypothetical protein